MLYSDNQCSDLLVVNPNTDWFNKDGGKQLNNTWYFNNFFDVVIDNLKPILDKELQPLNSSNALVIANSNLLNVDKNSKNFFDLSKFINKFAIIRLYIDNINQYDVYINNIELNFNMTTI